MSGVDFEEMVQAMNTFVSEVSFTKPLTDAEAFAPNPEFPDESYDTGEAPTPKKSKGKGVASVLKTDMSSFGIFPVHAGFSYVFKNPYRDAEGKYTTKEKAIYQGGIVLAANAIPALMKHMDSGGDFESQQGKDLVKAAAKAYYKYSKHMLASGLSPSSLHDYLNLQMSSKQMAMVEPKLKATLASMKAWEKIYQKKSLDALDKDYPELLKTFMDAPFGPKKKKAELAMEKKLAFWEKQYLQNGGDYDLFLKKKSEAIDKVSGVPLASTQSQLKPSLEPLDLGAAKTPTSPEATLQKFYPNGAPKFSPTDAMDQALAQNKVLGTYYYSARSLLGQDHKVTQDAYAEWQKTKDELKAKGYPDSIGALSVKSKEMSDSILGAEKAKAEAQKGAMEQAKSDTLASITAASYAHSFASSSGASDAVQHQHFVAMSDAYSKAEAMRIPDEKIIEAVSKGEQNAKASWESNKAIQGLLSDKGHILHQYTDDSKFKDYGNPAIEYYSHSDSAVAGLSPAEKEALKKYTGSGYKDSNKAVSSGASTQFTELIQKALDKCTLGVDMKLRRNAPQRWFWESLGVSKDKMDYLSPQEMASFVGKTYTEKAFSSTSRDLSFSGTFSKEASNTGEMRLNIRALASTKGLDVTNISNHHNENEVILQRGTTYIIRAIKPGYSHGSKGGGLKYVVDVDVIGVVS